MGTLFFFFFPLAELKVSVHDTCQHRSNPTSGCVKRRFRVAMWLCVIVHVGVVHVGAALALYSEQLLEERKQKGCGEEGLGGGLRQLTQGSICNWEVLVSGSPVINHPRPILFFDSSLQGLTFNTHDPGRVCARDKRLQETQKLNRMTLFPSLVSGRSEAKQIQINNSHLHHTLLWWNDWPVPLTLKHIKQLNERVKRPPGPLD